MILRLFFLIGFVCASIPASAGISDISGRIQIVQAPSSVATHQTESNDTAVLFLERQTIVLEDDVFVDVAVPGTYVSASTLTPGRISAGTSVTSYMIHADIVGSMGGSSSIDFDGAIHFDERILGLMISSEQLDASDGTLGAPTTVYGTGVDFGRRTVVSEAGDRVTLNSNLQSLNVIMRSGLGADQVRIVTLANPTGLTDMSWVGDQATFDGAFAPPTGSFHDANNWFGFELPSLSNNVVFRTDHPPDATPGTINAAPHYIYFGDFFDERIPPDRGKEVKGGQIAIGSLDIRNGPDWTFDFSSPNGPVDGKLLVAGEALIAHRGPAGLFPSTRLTLDNGEIVAGSVRVGGIGPGVLRLREDAILTALNVVVESNGRISGSGTIRGNVEVQGELEPGESPGALTIDGDVHVKPNGRMVMEIGGTVAASEYDQLKVLGDLDIEGQVELSFIDDFVPKVGDRFELFDADGSLSASFQLVFANAPEQFDYISESTDGTFSFTVISVPESSSIILGSVALYCWLGFGRRSGAVRFRQRR